MDEIVASTNWWSVDLCSNCNNEYGHRDIHKKVNCSNCGKVSTILAPHYTTSKRKVWTVKYPWWMIWKWHKNKSHFEYYERIVLQSPDVQED